MSRYPLQGTDAAAPFLRGLAALGFVAVFVVVAMIVRPSASTARSTATEPPRTAARMPAYVGSLEGKDLRVDVFVTADGARYTVRDGGGSIVAKLIELEQLSQRFPQFQDGALTRHMADVTVDDSSDGLQP